MLEILGTIGFDYRVAIANLVSFLIIYFILKRYVFGPVKKLIDERQATIQSGIDKAQQSETELLVAQQKAEEEIKSAKAEANQIIAEAKEVADVQVQQAKNNAHKEASQILENANVQIEKNKIQMEQELFQKTAHLVALGVQKILDEDVDQKRNATLNERALEILKQH
ncbi:F0F1 ATP synthase subunit B [Patescibacteria group bacterium]|nr:F0F1 ATP synthase subunit B [Patescibacteria group bacterium]